MSATLQSPRAREEPLDRARPTPPPSAPGRRARTAEALRRRRASALWLLPLLIATAAARIVNLGGAPQRVDDEGTYVAQAYAIERLGELAHYTYWYDHPPLGWIQLAGWTWLTGGFDRYEHAVHAGREAMVLAAVVSAALLWVLARRLGLGRPAAAGAVALFALSPLAVQFTLTVYLDNIATPWLLAAFVLALSRHNQLLAFAGAAACFGVAVLTKETTLLLLPFLVWQLIRSAHPSTRRYTLSVAAALVTLMGVAYIAFALVKGELMPGADRVSLWEGIRFQLISREGSGSVLDPESQAGRSVLNWLTLDAALLLGGLAAAAAALFVHRLRPYAAAYLLLTVMVVRPGYLPVPFVIAALPFAALLVAGVIEAGWRRGRRAERPVARVLAPAAASALAVAVLAGAALTWPAQLRVLWTSDLDRPLSEAQDWLAANVAPQERVLVDDAAWVDLVESGLEREQVIWYYKADTDSDVVALTPNGWQDYDYVLLTDGMRQAAGSAPVTDSARDNSVVAAAFGEGDERVEILRVLAGGTDDFYERDYRDELGRSGAGALLDQNAAVGLGDEQAAQLAGGDVDARVVTLLAQLGARFGIDVEAFPAVPGEEDGELPLRTVRIGGVGDDAGGVEGAAADELIRFVEGQQGAFRPQSVERADGAITLRYPVADPADLLPEPTP